VQYGGIGASAVFPLTFMTARLFPVSATKKWAERTTILDPRRHCKSDESTHRVIGKKWFPGMLPRKLYERWENFASLPKGTIL
jgi:hypothetical protein